MKKTIGGDRLGSGKKMKVELHGYERSTHDLGYVFRTTMSAGTLVPFLKEIALPGDSFDIDLNLDVKTHPTVGPLFGSYKAQIDIFQCPIRLYQGQLHNNKLGIGLKMDTVKLPKLDIKAYNSFGIVKFLPDLDNWQINPSCIFSYLGIRGPGTYVESGGDQFKIRQFNAVPFLSYWDIYKNYYSNKQEEIGAVIHYGIPNVNDDTQEIKLDGNTLDNTTTPANSLALNVNSEFMLTQTVSGVYQNPDHIMIFVTNQSMAQWIPLSTLATETTVVAPLQKYTYKNNQGIAYAWAWAYIDDVGTAEINVVTFPLTNIDDMREEILQVTPLSIGISEASPAPYSLPLEVDLISNKACMAQSQEGLALKTYQSDLLNNWLDTEVIDGVGGISEITSIDTSGGSFKIDTLLLSKKVYDMLNRIAISGGTYDDWMDAVYTHDRYTRAETPIYHGGLIKELVFQEVVSNAAVTDEAQPLGTLAGKGVMSNKHKGGQVTIKVDEPSYIIGIISLTPRLDYSQGNDWDVHLENMNDLHKPALDEIGFQELITEQMAWWDTFYDNGTNSWKTKSAGKQPAWINYMTNINRVRGNFAIEDNEMFMTLNRKYEADRDPITNLINIKDLTTYIDPRIYNHLFADTSIDSQNFWTQIGIDMKVRRKISAKIMPNL